MVQENELIVDNFAGGGGASTGIEQATGRYVDIAINHDAAAIRMHAQNHRHTRHLQENIFDVDPKEATGGRPVGLAWFSPDCTHFSRAKGAKPVKKNIRALSWVVLRWAASVRPRVIILENVPEFQGWGPLDKNGRPCKLRRGQTYAIWRKQLENLGYEIDSREIIAADYGAPTIRKRFFLIARCDGRPIIWPEPSHGPGRASPWRAASEIIDWSLPCPSIFERKRPLAEATLKRIARGIWRFVIEAEEPFIVNLTHGGRLESIGEPLRTITAANRGEKALVSAFLTKYYGERSPRERRGVDLCEPIHTITSENRFGVIAAHLCKHYGGGYTGAGNSLRQPAPTVTSIDHNSLVTSHLVKLRGTCKDGQRVCKPLPTITAGGTHVGEVRAFLIKYYGNGFGQDLNEPLHTITSKDRLGVVQIKGEPYQIVDIGMRMLQPHELFAAQGFPPEYNLSGFTKTDLVKLCGNSVCPPIASALVDANVCQDELYDAVIA